MGENRFKYTVPIIKNKRFQGFLHSKTIIKPIYEVEETKQLTEKRMIKKKKPIKRIINMVLEVMLNHFCPYIQGKSFTQHRRVIRCGKCLM